MAAMESVAVGDKSMDVYVDHPTEGAPWPAIVLTYHREGIDDFTKWVAQRYAEAGYLVAVPEVSHRIAADVDAKDRKYHLKDDEIVADIAATVGYLKTRSDVAQGRLAIAGHCMGGHMQFLAAAALPDFAGIVACYPTGLFESWGGPGPTPFERLAQIKCPVIGLFGNDDRNPSPHDADRLDAELTRLGIAHELHRYDGCGHGFQRPTKTEPVVRAAQDDSWQRIFAFLAENLALPA
ncbi:MAG TPA: dienelactone hydrolase family protein [Beijerinckiaceae bacterium]|jgi:carboxymethylenebutenolidase|nr:dienelactone hydrolase family protein [Beijerinckiaceae bacterium]